MNFERVDRDPAQQTQLTIVVPCYNEEDGIDLLADRLAELETRHLPQYFRANPNLNTMTPEDVEFILVDDGSTDNTLALIREKFGPNRLYHVINHPANLGIAQAISTGINAARSPLVCSIDADCSYDPKQLTGLLLLMERDVSMVTASPYHPNGHVVGVINWRLALSKFASFLYRHLLSNKLHTYTSCFRVYRRDDVVSLPLNDTGFVGITEMLWRLDQSGCRVVEAPATLTRRRFGVSKMNVLRSSLAHLRLMSTIVKYNLTGNKRPHANAKASANAGGAPGIERVTPAGGDEVSLGNAQTNKRNEPAAY